MLNPQLARIHKVVSYGYIAFACIGLLIAVMGLFTGENVGVGFGLACILLTLPGLFHWYASKGAGLGTRWGRNMSRCFGILALFGFPLGTALGVYILIQTGAKWQPNRPPADS